MLFCRHQAAHGCYGKVWIATPRSHSAQALRRTGFRPLLPVERDLPLSPKRSLDYPIAVARMSNTEAIFGRPLVAAYSGSAPELSTKGGASH